jgi:hypothetical protein
MKTHIQIVAVLNILSGLLCLIIAAFVFIFLATVGGFVASQGGGDAHEAGGIIWVVTVFISGFLALLGLPNMIAGWGLYVGKPWAKPLTLALAVLSLFFIPIGTLLGIYTFWALLHEPQPQQALPATI